MAAAVDQSPTNASGRLAGKVAIVTGAGGGIGSAAARRFVAEGARVMLLSRTAATGEAVAAAANAVGGGAEAIFRQTDVTIGTEVEAAVAETVARWGKLDIMFNVAGGSGRRFGDGPVADCTEEGWLATITLNLTSVFLCCKYGVQAMLAGGQGGAIVNLTSVLGLVGGDEHFGTHAYAASKGGIVALTRAIASYYAPERIRANVIAPGLIRTKMSHRTQTDPEILEALPRLQPLTGDFGTPDDVAEAALYLASDAAAFVTGIVLPVDGGWTVR